MQLRRDAHEGTLLFSRAHARDKVGRWRSLWTPSACVGLDVAERHAPYLEMQPAADFGLSLHTSVRIRPFLPGTSVLAPAYIDRVLEEGRVAVGVVQFVTPLSQF